MSNIRIELLFFKWAPFPREYINKHFGKERKELERLNVLMKSRTYSHTEFYLPSKEQVQFFGNNGLTIKKITKRSISGNKWVRVDITDKGFNKEAIFNKLQEPLLNTSYTTTNHELLVLRGFDDSNHDFNEDGIPKYFTCSTYAAWVLGLDKYDTFNSDKLYQYITGRKR